MHVLIDYLTALRRRTGIGHYVAELVRHLQATAAPEDAVSTYPGPLETALLRWRKGSARGRGPDSAGGERDGGWRQTLLTWGRRLSDWHFRVATWARRFDLYHEPNAIPLPCSRPTIATVCDLSVVLHPEWHPLDRVRHYERHFEAGLRRCRHVLAISEQGRREILTTFGLPPHQVTATPLGVRPGYRPLPAEEVGETRRRLGLPERFLLHVGTLEPRKNLEMLLRAYCSLDPGIRERCSLVLVGGWGWNVASLRRFHEEEGRHRGVVHLGYVPEKDLPALYNAARALVFPSHYEGFGLPPLEMLACGGAVLASTAPAVREVVGDHAHSTDPADEEGWRTALARAALDDDWIAALRAGGPAWAARFTWRTCAERTWSIYRKVLESSSRDRAA